MLGYENAQTAAYPANKRTLEEVNFDATESIGKKPRGSETVNPSKVLHVRSLPQDCTEQDLIGIACPFGRVVSVLLLKGKGQAFVQMENVQCATALTQYYNTVQANIRNRPIYFQYSNREEIATPSPGSSSSSGNSSSGSFNEKQNNILLVTVLNLVYPVGIDVLHRVFSKYGQILKIVIFSKSAGFQALIQFSDVASAVQAKQELDGQNIYAGCCTLKIQYSNLSNLTVKFNNESSRDFTNPTLPTTAPAAVSGAMPLSFPGSDATLQGWPWLGNPSMGSPYVYTGTSPKSLGNMNGVPPASGNAQCAVLIVSGLDPDKSTPDTLFTLFGVYGDVTRVKILYNKKDTALIQFSTPQQAETALVHLNGCPLYGGTLRVNFSKHQAIAMPRPGADQATDLTQDFTGSPLHRYKVLGSKNFHHIFPPSPVLHLSNLPLTLTEEQLREEFAKFGTVANFKFFAKDKRMGLIQMGSVSEAVEALIGMHNARLDESNIRVSFSKASM